MLLLIIWFYLSGDRKGELCYSGIIFNVLQLKDYDTLRWNSKSANIMNAL